MLTTAFVTFCPAIPRVLLKCIPKVLEQDHRSFTSTMSSSPTNDSGVTSSTGKEVWKENHPYRTPTQDADFSAKWKGACYCGKVQYELSREEPMSSKYCHCKDCQRLHGVSSIRSVFSTSTTWTHLKVLPMEASDSDHLPRHPSNGPQSSINPTFASSTAPKVSPGTPRLQTSPSTNSPARSTAQPATRPSWTKAGT